MKRTAQEMIEKFREVIKGQSEDEIANFLEDINDSVNETDLSGYVDKKTYETAVMERDKAESKAKDYRDRYINRFYEAGNATNDITIVEGGAPQLQLEQEEKKFSYADLFE